MISIKTILSALLIGGILMVFTLFGHVIVHTEIEIPASPEEVWAILMDKDGYKEWNPVLIPVEGNLKEGEKLKYRMIQPDGKESLVDTKVIKLEERNLLNQYGGIPGILTFTHKWILEPAGNGTRVIQHEEYRGIGVWFWDYSWVEPTYRKANEALKSRVFSLNKALRDSG
ncbi:MAG: SRPBCC domain-containing protein [Candidatus Thiodiazotropha sp.]